MHISPSAISQEKPRGVTMFKKLSLLSTCLFFSIKMCAADDAGQNEQPPQPEALVENQQSQPQQSPWKLPPNVLEVIRTKGEMAILKNPNNPFILQEVGIFLLFGDSLDAKR